MRLNYFTKIAIIALSAFSFVPLASAQNNFNVFDEAEKLRQRGRQPHVNQPRPQHIPQPHVNQPRPQHIPQPHVNQPRPQYIPQPHVNQPRPQHHPRPHHQPQPHWGGGRPQFIPVPQYIDRPVYVQPEPQYYQQPRYYEEEPQYRPRRAVRKRQICRTVWARDDYGRRYKVKRCRARR